MLLQVHGPQAGPAALAAAAATSTASPHTARQHSGPAGPTQQPSAGSGGSLRSPTPLVLAAERSGSLGLKGAPLQLSLAELRLERAAWVKALMVMAGFGVRVSHGIWGSCKYHWGRQAAESCLHPLQPTLWAGGTSAGMLGSKVLRLLQA